MAAWIPENTGLETMGQFLEHKIKQKDLLLLIFNITCYGNKLPFETVDYSVEYIDRVRLNHQT